MEGPAQPAPHLRRTRSQDVYALSSGTADCPTCSCAAQARDAPLFLCCNSDFKERRTRFKSSPVLPPQTTSPPALKPGLAVAELGPSQCATPSARSLSSPRGCPNKKPNTCHNPTPCARSWLTGGRRRLQDIFPGDEAGVVGVEGLEGSPQDMLLEGGGDAPLPGISHKAMGQCARLRATAPAMRMALMKSGDDERWVTGPRMSPGLSSPRTRLSSV